MKFDKTIKNLLAESKLSNTSYTYSIPWMDGGNTMYYADATKKQLHRVDGPAVEYPNGDKEWWVNGKRHREDGPAVCWKTLQQYYIHNKHLTFEEFNEHLKKLKVSKEIQGHKNNRIDPGMLEDYL